jgi:hypothetical protein
MNKRTIHLLAAGMMVFNAATAQTIYTRPHELLVETITSGSAKGILTGEIDEHFTREFKTAGSLFVNARVISVLDRSDCKRLELVLTKKDVSTPHGRTDAVLTTRLNYCKDGRPPIGPGES